SSSLIGHLLAAANGASVARGSTWLRDGLDSQVLPKGIDLIEDPRRARVTGSKPFDAEGLRATAYTQGEGWSAIVTDSQQILIFDSEGNLRQTIAIELE
ncbi:MAG: metallopeptidase TldD-related protein, partial [Mangrovicoccus sp.]